MINTADEFFGLPRNGTRVRRTAIGTGLLPFLAEYLPVLLHNLQRCTRIVVPRYRQRPCSIAFLQQRQADVELVDQQCQTLLIGAGQGLCQLPGLHAHAPRLIDGGSPPFE